jgi:hypothetical protein
MTGNHVAPTAHHPPGFTLPIRGCWAYLLAGYVLFVLV